LAKDLVWVKVGILSVYPKACHPHLLEEKPVKIDLLVPLNSLPEKQNG